MFDKEYWDEPNTKVAEELLQGLQNLGMKKDAVLAAELCCRGTDVLLLKDHTPEEASHFWETIEGLSYYDGYGGQELFGKVWLSEGVWLERGEYDGSEWWRIHRYPAFPKPPES